MSAADIVVAIQSTGVVGAAALELGGCIGPAVVRGVFGGGL